MTTELGADGIRNPVFHHINLKTTRFDELIGWYGHVVGMRPNFRHGSVAFLTNDSANHRIARFGAGFHDDPERETHTGLHHSAFEFCSLADLLGRYVTLKEFGILPSVCVDHGPTMSFYYEDPDGNKVEMQVDNFEDWAESTEWMQTSTDFIADPIGKLVDPELLVMASAQGISAREIHERAYAGGYLPADHNQYVRPAFT